MKMSHTLSTLATFDDLRRCIDVLTDGTAEQEFLRMLAVQEKFRRDCLSTAQEAQRIQKELDASLQSMADLESKLFHARRMLEVEHKARRDAENERDQLEKKMVALADLLQNERNLKDETRDKMAFLHTLPRKRKSVNRMVEEKYGNDINSTGSFLSDLSITQSEDDFLDVRPSNNWHRHRPSLPKNQVPCVGNKRTRLSGGGDASFAAAQTATPPSQAARRSSRRSGGIGLGGTDVGVQQHTLNVAPGSERICATTKVIIPQDGVGVIRTESTIESTPLKDRNTNVEIAEKIGDGNLAKTSAAGLRSPYNKATAPPMTPASRAMPDNSGVVAGGGSPAQQQLRPNLLRQHNFASKTFIRTDSCMQCQKKIRFGSVGLRCRDCSVRCHVDCRYFLAMSCVPQSGTPTIKGMMGYVTDYAPAVPPMIPALIVHCVNEIETRGLGEVGIYRVSGSEREVKALKTRFLRSKVTPHLGNIDIHVLSGCIKDFLRSLQEPLIPTGMWTDFCNAVQNPLEKDIQRDLLKAVEALPQANRDTLSFLILHFQRIAECQEIMMPIENIARCFGPTIVGYSSPNPDHHALLTEVYTQCTVMQNLLKIPTEYWTQFVSIDFNKENMDTETIINDIGSNILARTPSHANKESIYATPVKFSTKKRKFFATPPYTHKK